MFYSSVYFALFLYAMFVLWTTMNGVVVMRTETLRIPFQRRRYWPEKTAKRIGLVMVLFGLANLSMISAFLVENL